MNSQSCLVVDSIVKRLGKWQEPGEGQFGWESSNNKRSMASSMTIEPGSNESARERTEYSIVFCIRTEYMYGVLWSVISTARRHTATALAPFPPPQPHLCRRPLRQQRRFSIVSSFWFHGNKQKKSRVKKCIIVFIEWFWIVITLTVSAVKPTTLRPPKVRSLPFSSPPLSASHSLVSPFFLYLYCLSVAPFLFLREPWNYYPRIFSAKEKKRRGKYKN